MSKDKIILDLYAGTGAASKEYAKAGYAVQRVTLPQDVRLCYFRRAYGIIACPPCTDLAGSGARWWEQKGQQALLDALSMVDAVYRIVALTNPKFWVLENPVGRLVHYIGKPKMYFQPYEYGDPWSKKTCLWGNFNIPKKAPVKPTEKEKIWRMPPSPNRGMLRSITPAGFAKAFFESNR